MQYFPHFQFFFSTSMWCCAFHLFNYFSGELKTGWRGSGDGGGKECEFIIICFKIDLPNFSLCLLFPFLLVPNNWDFLRLLLVLSLPFFSLRLLWLLFSYTHNQYNYLITYYSFICYLFLIYISSL